MITEQKQDTILRNSCGAKLTCEIWEGRQGMSAADIPEDFLSYRSYYNQYQDAYVFSQKLKLGVIKPHEVKI